MHVMTFTVNPVVSLLIWIYCVDEKTVWILILKVRSLHLKPADMDLKGDSNPNDKYVLSERAL